MSLSDATPKRGQPQKALTRLGDRYPALSGHGDVSGDEQKSIMEALNREMQAPKPRKDVYLPLMKSSFIVRRQNILHTSVSARHIISDYPALKEATAVRNFIGI